MRNGRLAVFTAVIGLAAMSSIIPLTAQWPPAAQPGVISGELRTMTGAPAANMRVLALEAQPTDRPHGDSRLAAMAQTDHSGTFRIDGLPPGRYYLTAGALDSPVYYPGVPNVEAATVITVMSGAVAAGMNFSMVRTEFKLSGRFVQDDDSSPLFPIQIKGAKGYGSALVLKGPRSFRAVLSDKNRTFEWLNAPAGVYTLGVAQAFIVEDFQDVDIVLIEENVLGTSYSGAIVGEKMFPVLPATLEVRDRDVHLELRLPKTRKLPE